MGILNLPIIIHTVYLTTAQIFTSTNVLALIIFIYLLIYIAKNVDIAGIHTACMSYLLTL